MRRYKKKARLFLSVLILTSTILSMHRITTPFINLKSSGGASTPTGSDMGQAKGRLRQSNRNGYYIEELNDKGLMTEVIKNSFINKSPNDIKRLSHRMSITARVSLIGIWIMLSVHGLCQNRSHRTGSLLAFSLGGHAPPLSM